MYVSYSGTRKCVVVYILRAVLCVCVCVCVQYHNSAGVWRCRFRAEWIRRRKLGPTDLAGVQVLAHPIVCLPFPLRPSTQKDTKTHRYPRIFRFFCSLLFLLPALFLSQEYLYAHTRKVSHKNKPRHVRSSSAWGGADKAHHHHIVVVDAPPNNAPVWPLARSRCHTCT